MPDLQLAQKTLSSLNAPVVRSSLNKEELKAGILHLGIGAFHRAHQAIYTQQAMEASPGNWGIIGVSFRSPKIRDQLADQDHYYSLISHSTQGVKATIVSVIKDVTFAKEDPKAVIEMIADPAIKIITLTVTEKGYYQDPATGKLQLDHADIIHDLDLANEPRTVLGYLVRGLKLRQKTCDEPVTLLSCDNLPENGRVLFGLIRDFCEHCSADLMSWVTRNTTCPSTMVDGIVPAATSTSLQAAEHILGVRDCAAVTAEDFRQWVIEDDFAGDHPDWKSAGVEFVSDVRPFEDMKLRLLNGCHSALAYLGYLGGFQTIADVMTDPTYRNFAYHLIRDEAGQDLSLPAGYDIERQAQTLIERFSNPGLAHSTTQICMDGSQKLPQRILASLYGQLKKGNPASRLLLAVSAWIIYVGGKDEQGRTIEISDPLAKELAELHADAGGDPGKLATAFLSVEKIFGPKTDQPVNLTDLLAVNLAELMNTGARQSVARLENRENAHWKTQ